MNKNIKGDFQICISVPLRIYSVNVVKFTVYREIKSVMENIFFCAAYDSFLIRLLISSFKMGYRRLGLQIYSQTFLRKRLDLF